MNPAETKILVVDDIPSARRVVIRMLSLNGFTNYIEAGSLAEARQALGSDTFNLVISDVHLRDGKGTDLLRHIEDTNPKLPVILVTSDMDKGTFDEASKIRVTAYLLKPFSPTSLLEKINQVLVEA